MSDLRQSEEWGKYLESRGWLVEEVEKTQLYIRKIPFLGSVTKIQRPSVIPPTKKIDKIAKKYRALFVKLEPTQVSGIKPQASSLKHQLSASGFQPDSWPLLPTRTIHLDLTADEETILSRMSKDARYCIRRAEKNGVIIKISDFKPQTSNLKQFYHLFKQTGRRKKFWVPKFKDLKTKVDAFGPKAYLLLATIHKPIAGALILIHKGTTYYHHAASNALGRKLLAPYAIVWETIKLAKSQGCNILDLEGIYDPRFPKLTKKWKGFTRFKKKFGGEIVEYEGSFIKYYNPAIRLLFKLYETKIL